VGRTLLRRSGIPGAWLRCSITEADGEDGDEASLSVGEEEVEAEAACILSAGILELETLAMALIKGWIWICWIWCNLTRQTMLHSYRKTQKRDERYDNSLFPILT
jgi:hypothetical protein